MERKHYKHSVKDVNNNGIVTIAISKFDVVDSDGDIVRKGAFKKTFSEMGHRIKHVVDHWFSTQMLVGLPTRMEETSTHAIVESKLNLEKQIARDLLSDYKFFADNGKSLEHSYGYQILKREENNDIGGVEITELKMFEYSTVLLAANENTPLMGIKSLKTNELEVYLRSNYDISEEKGKFVEKIIKAINSLSEPSIDTLEKIFNEPLDSTLDLIDKFKKETWTAMI